jgi:hypothetical protein
VIEYFHDGKADIADAFCVTTFHPEDVSAFRDAPVPKQNEGSHRWNQQTYERQFRNAKDGDDSWYGGITSWEGAKAIIDGGWGEGARRTTELSLELGGRIASFEGFRRRPKWGEQGEELDADRAMRGEWDNAWRDTVKKRVQGASNIVTLAAPFGGNAHQSAESLFWCGAQMIAVTDILESSGYQVEVIALANTRNHSYDDGKAVMSLLACRVKQAGEPMRPDAMASLFAHAGIFRTYIFEALLRQPCKVPDNLGSAQQSVAELTVATNRAAERGWLPPVDVIVGEAYNRDAAIKNIVATLKAVTGEDITAAA